MTELKIVFDKTAEAVNKAAENGHSEEPRPHMGCSLLGRECERELWLSFRWAMPKKFDGRILRLFQRGHDEEPRVVRWLIKAGFDVRFTGNNQRRVEFGSHVSGSVDGIIESGVPDAPNKRHILEIKTHNKKSFDDVKKHGVQKSKPVHYAQMQVYMLGLDIDRALYFAVCKDDDRIYTERVRLKKREAKKIIERGQRIATSDRMPEPMPGAAPDWYKCKFCDYYDFCHGSHLTTQSHCRTCAHSTAEQDGTWTCARYDNAPIAVEHQRIGCDSHVLHPDLVPWQRVESKDALGFEACYLIDGVEVRNGEPCASCYSSKEILANTSACVNPDDVTKTLRTDFDARIIESTCMTCKEKNECKFAFDAYNVNGECLAEK